MPHRAEESQTSGTVALDWDVEFVEASRRICLAPFWWYMPADTAAAPKFSQSITTAHVRACKLCSKVDRAFTGGEASQS